MSIWRNSRFAAVVMLLMIAAGTLVGSHNSLADLREKAAAVFTLGARGDGIGIQSDLNERAGIAYNLVVLARKYLPEDNALIQNAVSTATALASAGGIREKSAANRALETTVKDLADVLSSLTLSAQDARYPQRMYTDFRSRGDAISHDPYNQAAVSFNRILSGFPAKLLGGLTGIRPLELFE